MKRTLLLFTLCLSSCAADGYLAKRGRDLADCLTLTASAGLEASAGLHATYLAHISVGAGLHVECGLVGRNFGGGSVVTLGLPIAPFMESGILHGRYLFTEVSGGWDKDAVEDECYLIHALDIGNTSPKSDLWHAFDLEISAVALVGGRVGFSPGELVDFLAGLAGLDPRKDDGVLVEGASQ